MSRPAAQLLADARQVLAELELLSEAPAGLPPDSPRTRASGESRPPTRFTSLRDRHLEQLEEWLARARRDLHAAKVRAPSPEPETKGQRDHRIATDPRYAGMHYTDVAREERCGIMIVRRARAAEGLDPTYGKRHSRSW